MAASETRSTQFGDGPRRGATMAPGLAAPASLHSRRHYRHNWGVVAAVAGQAALRSRYSDRSLESHDRDQRCVEGLLEQAKGVVKKEGASRVGVDPETAECYPIAIGERRGAVRYSAEARYTISTVYICETFPCHLSRHILYSSNVRTQTREYRRRDLFRHVSAVNYHDRSSEIVQTRGKKINKLRWGRSRRALQSSKRCARSFECLRRARGPQLPPKFRCRPMLIAACPPTDSIAS